MRHPAQVVVAGFAAAVAVGTGLLMLPAATAGPGGAGLLEALFTATSTVCVTGLVVVDTASYWSGFGHVVILGLVQVGGFGIMTSASVLVLLVSHRMGLRARMTAATETRSPGLGDIRAVVTGVVKAALAVEAVTALVLTLRFAAGYHEPWPRAVWLGVFHGVSAFNNAGFALYSDSLMSFVTDPWICVPIALAIIAGGLGFPVLFEVRRRFRAPRAWSVHTRIALCGTGLFLVGGCAFVTAVEWSNPATLGPLDASGKLLAGFFQGATPRTAGFSSVDLAALHPVSLLGMDVLMFVGGSSAGTAGGIKVTTFAVLFFALYTEIRGESSVNVFGRRLSAPLLRQALTVALLSVAAVVLSTVVFMLFSEHGLDRSQFEVVSAFSTTGMSTGITARLPVGLQLLLVALMFVGRLGPVTVASALALRHRVRLYDLPEERPVIG
ncbi:TrkH family potassium uptake protein [Streptomyces fragilis]|uniref:Potassium transporter TrkG n=1 Tax=Streptomyces fragilis TaxID=67301 RepID=A0ABV2YHU2_9ACTN